MADEISHKQALGMSRFDGYLPSSMHCMTNTLFFTHTDTPCREDYAHILTECKARYGLNLLASQMLSENDIVDVKQYEESLLFPITDLKNCLHTNIFMSHNLMSLKQQHPAPRAHVWQCITAYSAWAGCLKL